MTLSIRFIIIVIIGITMTACPKIVNKDTYAPNFTDYDKRDIKVYTSDSVVFMDGNNQEVRYNVKFNLDTIIQMMPHEQWGGVRERYHYYEYGAILTSNDSNNYKIQHFVTNRFIHQSYFSISFSKNNSRKKLFGYELLSNLKMIDYSIGNEFDSVYFCTTTSNSIDNANSSFDTVFLTSKQGIVGWKFDGEPRWIRND